MSATSGVTLQINLAPSDWLHARYILPHQLQKFAHQVDEILLTLDLHRSAGRFAEGWEEQLPKMRTLIDECCKQYPHAHLADVNYASEVVANVSAAFFNNGTIPPKDFRGGPFYSYFFGLYAAKHSCIFHLDSDMMFGGGSSTWISEAVSLLIEHPDILVCAPLPGPPTPDYRLRSQIAERELHYSPAFRFPSLSSRIFLLNRDRFKSQIQQLPLRYAPIRGFIKAVVEGNYPYKLPEEILTESMQQHSLFRVDFLGKAPGMWSLHPPYRSNVFYGALPELIQKIESGDIPDAQCGDHDVNDSLVDWSSARDALKQNRWWKRLARKIRKSS